ncbi:MAG: tetratricopeptide repeat protein [Nitrospiraceae bacterium]|nr:tetratricopeptide repeat protein [Nitrospiraceae bacterium]
MRFQIRPASIALSFFILLATLPACSSLPRIVILHDALTPQEHLNLGVVYERKGELDAAMKQYKAAAKKLPLAYVYMGNVSFEKKDMSGAEKYYKKAIEKAPADPDAYNNLAWLYYTEKKKMDAALKLAMTATHLPAPDPAKKALYKDTLTRIRQYLASTGKTG